METGRATPDNPPQRIFVSGGTIYAFYFDGQAAQVEKIAVNTLHPGVPGAPVDPNGLAFTPDKAVIGKDETVYLLSKKYQSIFRWSVAQRRYLNTIPLLDLPSTIAYAPDENRLYVAYPNASIYQIRLDESLLETAFANLPGPACGLAIAGSFVFTYDPTGAWGTHSVFSPAGVMLSKKDWNYYSSEYIWNAARQKMYFFRDDTSPNDIIWENIDASGLIGTTMDSPYHTSAGIVHPIRVKQDGSIVLLGSGWMYDGLTLVQTNTLSNTINDAGWKDDSLVTLRANNNASELQKWLPVSYAIVKAQAVSGSPVNLFSVQEGWLVITNLAGQTRLTIWSEDFAPISNPPLADFSATPTAGDVPVEVHFSNLSSEGPYDSSLWDFGNGSTSTDPNPIHLYTQSGSFAVKLTVSGPSGSDTLIKTNAIQVRPVTANFSSSATRGEAPFNVQFTNQTTGQVNSYLWDFGDGTTSTDKNPAHTFSNAGSFTVTLTVDGPYGSSSNVKKNWIRAYILTYQYMLLITKPVSATYILAGRYEFNNLCQQFPLYVYGNYMGQMRECVPSVEVKENGDMYFNYTWTYFVAPNAPDCLVKRSDAGNRNMYIKDMAGNRYDHTAVDGNGDIYCLQNGVNYPGWFKFPAAQTRNTIFTFYDDDAWIRIGPIIQRAAP